jgi:hypothetical protein
MKTGAATIDRAATIEVAGAGEAPHYPLAK